MNDTFEARVTATFGRHLLVRDASGKELEARPFGRGLNVVCGDNVHCRADPHHDEIHVVEIIQRRTALYRSNVRGVTEPVVANLSRLMVVLAPVPVPDLFVVDRYLAAAESGGIAGLLVVNKIELGIDADLAAELDVFTAAGYRWFPCSVKTGEGIDAVLEVCAGQIAALVGQSGVGKSSLVDRLIPGADVEVGDLVREEEGRHTTTGVADVRPAPQRAPDRLTRGTRFRAGGRSARCAEPWICGGGTACSAMSVQRLPAHEGARVRRPGGHGKWRHESAQV